MTHVYSLIEQWIFLLNYRSRYFDKPAAKGILPHREITKQKADGLGSSVPEQRAFQTVLNNDAKIMSCLSTPVTPWRFKKIPNTGHATYESRIWGQLNECKQSPQVREYFDESYPIVLAGKTSFIKRLCASLWVPADYKNRLQGNRIWWWEGSHWSVVRCDEADAVLHCPEELERAFELILGEVACQAPKNSMLKPQLLNIFINNIDDEGKFFTEECTLMMQKK